MTTPRGFRDKADESLLTLIGEVPELVRNLVIAEVDSAKAWVGRTAKDAGIGAGWMVGALFLLFWFIPALLAFAIIGLSSWLAPWLSALIVVVVLLLGALVLALLGVLRFRKISKTENPGQSVIADVRIVKESVDEY